jgi:hypothetical protein
MLVTSLTATFMEVSFVARTSLARTSVTLTMVNVIISLANISVMYSTVPSITTHGMTALVTSTINVVRAAMTNLAACVTVANESIVGNHGALRASGPLLLMPFSSDSSRICVVALVQLRLFMTRSADKTADTDETSDSELRKLTTRICSETP